MLYPLKFKPIYKEIVWGGKSLQLVYNREIPFENTAESWDIACHPNGTSVISNGAYAGMTLQEIFDSRKEALLGKNQMHLEKFPLLVKLIDARDKLSLQVHPQDAYASVHENGGLGKCEMWYVLAAKPGAKLVVGLKSGVTLEMFRSAIEKGQLEPLINELEIKPGDVLNIPAGLLHAIEEDVLIAEIQQNSDTVYRVYDWNRMGLDGKPRQLHIQQAMDVIDFEDKIKKEITPGLAIKREGNPITYYIANKYFTIEKISLKEMLTENTKKDKMYLYTCLSGSFDIHWNGTKTSVLAGESALIPAQLGAYMLAGQGEILKGYIPDIEMDFIDILIKAGYSLEEIQSKTGLY